MFIFLCLSGQYVEGVAFGQGVKRFHNGNVYRGDFNHDVRHGFGEMNYKKGPLLRYVGLLEMNELNGEGTMWYRNKGEQGDVYVGM